MNKEVEQLLSKCDNCKLKECIGCEFTWTDIQKIRKYIQELEQKQSILDKVTDKLKEYLKAIKRDGIYGYDKEINEILNIIEGENRK